MNTEAVFGIFAILSIVLLVMVSYKGFLYDTLKEDIDKKYRNNHSITWRQGQFWFSIPRFIVDNSQNIEVQKKKTDYNRLSILFWTIVVIAATVYLTTGLK